MTRRGRLSAERILRAAINLVEESGLDALSMRNLGEMLGAGTMSLYNHVSGKDEILDGIVDLVAREIPVPEAGADWRTSLRQRAVSTREMILRHPWAAGLMQSRTTLGPARLRLLDAALGGLRRGGFSIEAAARALLLLDSYVYGFTLQEVSGRFAATTPSATAQALRPQVDAPSFPHLSELLVHIMSGASGSAFTSLGAEFGVGLDVTLDAMERLLVDA